MELHAVIPRFFETEAALNEVPLANECEVERGRWKVCCTIARHGGSNSRKRALISLRQLEKQLEKDVELEERYYREDGDVYNLLYHSVIKIESTTTTNLLVYRNMC